jgi:hypothetical protein
MQTCGSRPHLEDAFPLDLAAIMRNSAAKEERYTSGTVVWANTPDVALLEVHVVLNLSDGGGDASLSYLVRDPHTDEARTIAYCIHLETTRPHLGGLRWWFRCPVTGKRARKLYLYPGLERFCHRDAIDPPPTYALQRVSGFDRVLMQRNTLAAKLGNEPTFSGLGQKPKWMRWKTFNQYRQRDEKLQERHDWYLDWHREKLRER